MKAKRRKGRSIKIRRRDVKKEARYTEVAREIDKFCEKMGMKK